MYLTARMVIVMRINTLFYSIKQGFKNIFRNKMFSLASIATMAACIFMFGLFYIVVTNFSSMVKTAEEGVAVTVFFNEGTTEDVIKADKAQIEKRAEVGKVDYQSAAEEGIVTDVVFRGNRMDITVSINGIEVVGERSLEKDLIAVGEKVHVLIYRLYIFDEEKTYLMENSEMQEQDVFYI